MEGGGGRLTRSGSVPAVNIRGTPSGEEGQFEGLNVGSPKGHHL